MLFKSIWLDQVDQFQIVHLLVILGSFDKIDQIKLGDS